MAKKEDIRNDDGTIKKGFSLNPKGRPRNSKNQASKQKLDNLADKYGSLALKKIFEMGEAALAKGDTNTAYRCYSFVAGHYVTITLHNDRMEKTVTKNKPDELTDEESDDLQNGAVIQVNFRKADAV